MFVNAVDAAVLIDQFRCGLFANTGDTRKIVGRITTKSCVMDVIGGLHARAFQNASFVVQRVVGNAALVVEHFDVRIVN
ncbi:unannotated protein [freshwater metagenome]|uniref:Unannotated protein n=1 Tax=freshwater metagenome TaxID=449393 RepID=A0A6J6JSG6_9ZZZZ